MARASARRALGMGLSAQLSDVRMFLGLLIAIASGWVLFVAFLAVARPRNVSLRDILRLLPDTFKLMRGLAADRTLPRSVRVPVWLLVVYLAMPIDLVPDFVPVIGYADDAILTALILRRLVRKAGVAKLVQHWPGAPDQLEALHQLLRIPADSN